MAGSAGNLIVDQIEPPQFLKDPSRLICVDPANGNSGMDDYVVSHIDVLDAGHVALTANSLELYLGQGKGGVAIEPLDYFSGYTQTHRF